MLINNSIIFNKQSILLTYLFVIITVNSAPTNGGYKHQSIVPHSKNRTINWLGLSIDPEIFMNCVEIIKYHGYTAEEHQVTTDDGYILTIQRIPHGKTPYHGKKRNPIILQHGFIDISTAWVLNIPEKNLAYRLAEEGYDVWLGNIRGNSYGRKHLKWYTWDKEFWKFSFHEMGMYDIPAIIDHVLNTTGSRQVDYIGHSMGCTMMLVTLSARPEYNNKVRVAQLLGPVAANRYMCTPLRYVLYIEPILNLLPDIEVAPFFPITRFNNIFLCIHPAFHELCFVSFFLAQGFGNRSRFDASRFPVYLSHSPESTSLKTFLHFLQMKTGKFRWYDYGRLENYQRYGRIEPPTYNLSAITTPLVMYWSDSDAMISPMDVAILQQQLPSLKMAYEVPAHLFNHGDYFRAKNVDRLIFDKVMDVLDDDYETQVLH